MKKIQTPADKSGSRKIDPDPILLTFGIIGAVSGFGSFVLNLHTKYQNYYFSRRRKNGQRTKVKSSVSRLVSNLIELKNQLSQVKEFFTLNKFQTKETEFRIRGALFELSEGEYRRFFALQADLYKLSKKISDDVDNLSQSVKDIEDPTSREAEAFQKLEKTIEMVIDILNDNLFRKSEAIDSERLPTGIRYLNYEQVFELLEHGINELRASLNSLEILLGSVYDEN